MPNFFEFQGFVRFRQARRPACLLIIAEFKMLLHICWVFALISKHDRHTKPVDSILALDVRLYTHAVLPYNGIAWSNKQDGVSRDLPLTIDTMQLSKNANRPAS